MYPSFNKIITVVLPMVLTSNLAFASSETAANSFIRDSAVQTALIRSYKDLSDPTKFAQTKASAVLITNKGGISNYLVTQAYVDSHREAQNGDGSSYLQGSVVAALVTEYPSAPTEVSVLSEAKKNAIIAAIFANDVTK